MPGRVSRSSLPQQHHHHSSGNPAGPSSSHQKTKRKRKDRNLDAFAIAGKTDPDHIKVRRYRLGEVEGEEPRHKKQRLQGNEEVEDEVHASEPRRGQKTNVQKGEDSDLSVGEGEDGSDSEPYHVGPGEDDGDSDIESDDAFASGDEEKFEGFTFRGSKDARKKGSVKAKQLREGLGDGFDLSEDEPDQNKSEEDDDFGEEGVDLATMLDQSGSEDEEEPDQADAGRLQEGGGTDIASFADFDDNAGSEDMEDADDLSDSNDNESGEFDMSEDDSDADPERQQQLQEIISASKPQKTPVQSSEQEDRKDILTRALAALQSSNTHPTFTREAQRLSKSIQSSAKNSKKSDLVSAPLPKRQQDRIDRVAARAETNKTLDRWVDTVKHNRRAEHLSFPLVDPHAKDAQGTTKMISTASEVPQNDLERTIAGILKESGLGAAGGRAEEKQLQGFEELQTNKMPLEEVLARRAELQKQRELMFREEVKARRIKKIKSKAFRRVHRKHAQRAQQKEIDMLAAAGLLPEDLDEDEKEANDKRRAEERMGARHKESKWAKSVKSQGRQAWDDEARGGMEEMARRNEELRRRMEGGKQERDDMDSDVSSSENDDADGFGEQDERERLQSQLGRLDAEQGGEQSKLGQMAFMQRADAVRKKQNQEDAERLRRDLAGEDSQEEDDASEPDTAIGRRMFGSTGRKIEPQPVQTKRAEFEEGDESDDEAAPKQYPFNEQEHATSTAPQVHRLTIKEGRDSSHGPTLLPPANAKTFEPRAQAVSSTKPAVADNIVRAGLAKAEAEANAPNTNGWTTISMPRTAITRQGKKDMVNVPQEEASDSEGGPSETILPSNHDLVQSAFGTGDEEAAFAAEKASAASSEEEKFEDSALPGWGSWAGEGVSKREKKRTERRNKGRFVSKTADGVKLSERKDHKLDKVIISERRSRKSAKYLSGQLPHPFESRVQYERGLRLPIGPEWTTKETFQSQTKPRVLAKPGKAIQAMSQPML